MTEGEGPGEVVERSPHVLEAISDDYRQHLRQRVRNVTAQDILKPIRVSLVKGDSVRLEFKKHIDFVVERFEVLIRPIEFNSYPPLVDTAVIASRLRARKRTSRDRQAQETLSTELLSNYCQRAL